MASIKDLIISNKNDDAVIALENFKNTIDEYCEVYSINQNIKKESVKRSERIQNIEQEIT